MLAIWRFLQKINGQLLVNMCVYMYMMHSIQIALHLGAILMLAKVFCYTVAEYVLNVNKLCSRAELY